MDFGNVIASYTDEDAIEDGVLVRPFPDKAPNILFTAAVHTAIEAVDDGRTYAQKAIPLIQDANLKAQERSSLDQGTRRQRNGSNPLDRAQWTRWLYDHVSIRLLNHSVLDNSRTSWISPDISAIVALAFF